MNYKQQFEKEVEYLDPTEKWKELNYVQWLTDRLDRMQKAMKLIKQESKYGCQQGCAFCAGHYATSKQALSD